MNDVLLPLHYSHGCVEIICIVGTFPKPFARKESAKTTAVKSQNNFRCLYFTQKT